MGMSASPVTHLSGEFDAFVRARTAPLLRAAYVLTGDQHHAEDLVQTALARTHRAWSNLHATGAADAYTRKTMYHLQVSWWRRRRVAETLTGEIPAHAGHGPDPTESTALQLTLRELLLRLPPRQRAVLALRFFDDLTEAQTADVLGVNVGTVKSQTAKALAKLRVHAPELREFYSAAADESRPVELRDRALASSRRQAARRTAALSAAAALLVATIAVALTLAVRTHQQTPPAEPSPSPAPSATQVRARGEEPPPDLGPFHDVTIAVPAWAGERAAARCPTGQVRLDAHGSSTVGSGSSVWVAGWTETDVDADGDGDLVAILKCGEGPESPGTEVVAFRRDAQGRPVTIGRIVGTRDGFEQIHSVRWSDSGVLVELSEHYTDSGQESTPFQGRTYRLVDGKPRQVLGPTSFEADPPYAALRVDPGRLTLRPAAGGRYAGRLRVTVANDGKLPVNTPELTLSLRGDWLRPAGSGWENCTRVDYTDPVSFQVFCTLDQLWAGASVTVEFEFTVDALPAELNPKPEVEWDTPYRVEVGQWQPEVFEHSPQREAPFTVVLG